MPDAGVHVIGAGQHEDARGIGGRAPRQCRPCHRAQIGAKGVEGIVTGLYRMLRFLQRETGKNRAETSVELLWHEGGVAKRDQGRHMADAVLRKDICFLQKTRLGVFRRRCDTRAGERGDHVPFQIRGQRVDHGRKKHVDFVVPVERKQLAVVAVDAFHGVAAVDGAASLAELACLIFRAVRRELEPSRIYAERTEEADPELVR